jgi:hypothetical protein
MNDAESRWLFDYLERCLVVLGEIRDRLPAKQTYMATCCKCGKVCEIDTPPPGLFFCSYGCT